MRLVNSKSTYRIMISGGGTGGHIYPAIAIADALRSMKSHTEIMFVGAKGKMEMEKVPEAGYKIVGLWISGIQRRLTTDNLSFPFKLIASIWKSLHLLSTFKPDAVVGAGGYASGPLVYVAAKRKIPTLIQEQNAFAGITNKLLAAHVDRVCVASDGMERFFPREKIVYTGNPVKTDILNVVHKREQARQFFGLKADKPILLILGGSLGARTLNEAVISGLDELIAAEVQVIWQTGKRYHEEMLRRTKDKDMIGIKAWAFLNEMNLAYAAADLVVSRAGALSIAELCLAAKPVIFVPSPNVSEDHQTKNAEQLLRKGAGIIVKDTEAIAQLVSTALDLLRDEKRRKELALNIARLGRPDAAYAIANEIIKLIT